ncbi:hypothetical protein I4F81_005069 [Pyropia yezoensis]|uniref:Uncharacterized protein n=1 Tax=Pyropia yezoensis TaxID=2788 RepID=A0ACC3BWT0_PYRYE|nr:hypothetical protein I4F81_005069 [Neopyropia yezoensis]
MTAESLTAGGGVGAKVRCSVCKHVWFQKADRLNGLAPGLGMKDYPEDRKETTVFVGNLPFAASEAELRDLLTSTGAGVNKVTMVSDQDGRPKGFAFAEMATEADMRSVVDGLDGASLGGRNVSVREGNK